MSETTPSLLEAMDRRIWSHRADMHTALPGTITAYTAATQTCSVQPDIKMPVEFTDGQVENVQLPIISDVPVVFPRTAEYVIYLPVAKSDRVLIIFNERDLSNWFVNPLAAPPVNAGSLDTHPLSAAAAIVGFYPATQPLVGASLESDIVIGKDLSVALTGDYVAWAGEVDTALANIKSHLDTIKSAVFDAWIVFPQDGGAALNALVGTSWPASPTIPATVGCSDVKVT